MDLHFLVDKIYKLTLYPNGHFVPATDDCFFQSNIHFQVISTSQLYCIMKIPSYLVTAKPHGHPAPDPVFFKEKEAL